MTRRTGLLLVLAASLGAQSPEYEVASFKLSPPPEGDRIDINLGVLLHGRVTFANATLSDCLKFAYGLSSDAQLEGPEWMRRAPRFDVVAQTSPDTPRTVVLQMTQTLIAERLHLRSHREDRRLTYLALVRGKNIERLKPAVPEATRSASSIPGRIVGPRMDMILLAKVISRFERQPVIDETGLDGLYDVHLEYAPEMEGAASVTPAEADRIGGPSLYSAIQDQLGLRLEKRKGPVSVLVVDSADQSPVGN